MGKVTANILVGMHEELMRLGFGSISTSPRGEHFVRVTVTKRGKSPEQKRMRVESLQLSTGLWQEPNSPRRNAPHWKWWKNDLGRQQVIQLVVLHSEFSADVDQEFTINGLGKLIRGSQKLLIVLN